MTAVRELLNRAIAMHQQGQLDAAETLYGKVLTIDTRNADALNLLGAINNQRGRHQEALELLQRADSLRPRHPFILLNLGNALRGLGRLQAALERYQAAADAKPDYAQAHHNLGAVHRLLGDTHRASTAFRTALRLDPGQTDSLMALGDICRDRGAAEEAYECYTQVLDRRPGDCAALTAAGAMALELGRFDKAEQLLSAALQAEPGDAAVANALAVSRMRQGRLLDALTVLRSATATDAAPADVWTNAGSILVDLMRQSEAQRVFREGMSKHPTDARLHSAYLLSLLYRADAPQDDILEKHRHWGAMHGNTARLSLSAGDASRNSRIRIGYVSADLREHSVAYFLQPLLRHRDRASFEVTCYSCGGLPDAVTERLRLLSDSWRDISRATDADAAAQIAADRIDILVDLAGHTGGNRLTLFACRPAPVQVTYIGYPHTTGVPAMDFRIVDAETDPPGSERFCTERLWRLPGCFLCYAPPQDAPAVAERGTTEGQPITFGCFNNAAKINDRVLDAWCRILTITPASRLLIKSKPFNDPRVRELFIRQMAARNIAAERIEVMGRVAAGSSHLDVYNRVDIALDTFPYNGTTTTCEALWMGVPVVTCAGAAHAARVGRSLLKAVGLVDLAASSVDEYVSLAGRLAADTQRLAAARDGLRDRMARSGLCDGPGFMRAYEDALRQMLRMKVG